VTPERLAAFEPIAFGAIFCGCRVPGLRS
jgi:hypothetical protein